MKLKILFVALCVHTFLNLNSVQAQQNTFNLELYNQFLKQNQSLSVEQMLEMYPAGMFQLSATTELQMSLYLNSIEQNFGLTPHEKSLIGKHGFLVTERLSDESFGNQFLKIYHKDLPVFVSTDAILHAFHCSYDQILKETELRGLITAVRQFLDNLHQHFPELATRYSGNPSMKQMLRDVDLYLTVPRQLLTTAAMPYFIENTSEVDRYLGLIKSFQVKQDTFLAETARKIDFSQFKPRGHYTDTEYPQLAAYFKAMMWLGRMEIYLFPPRSDDPTPTFGDVQRQIVDAALMSELVEISDAELQFEEIEKTISYFVGEQDNVTLPELDDLLGAVGIPQADLLLDSLAVVKFQDTLKTKPFFSQKILSQILSRDPMNPDSIIPASAFLLFGQRFIIDSYVTGSVVWDRIRAMRMLPSTLDILFAMGNNAAAQLLTPEISKFKYAPNLAALRYLVDSYGTDFWNATIYTGWLNLIRTLNSPTEREALPAFMQTAAWWQEKMNTQLASWTELRHDNLLYAKQSYSGNVICSFPYSYVEPVPPFYEHLSLLASRLGKSFGMLPLLDDELKIGINDYFEGVAGIADTLKNIANKELSGEVFNPDEVNFLKSMINDLSMCGIFYDGWYPRLFYPRFDYENGLKKADYLVADYHTAPSDEFGNPVGWVAHAGTGPVDMAVVVTGVPDGSKMAFIGPVMGYHEYTTTNFQRLTDEEWKGTYLQTSLRPDWVNIYLADKNGESRGEGSSLVTGINEKDSEDIVVPVTHLLAQNYPNPFNPSTLIRYIIPASLSHSTVKITVYDVQGKPVKQLLEARLPSGNYLTRWDGTDEQGVRVANGVYFYNVTAGQEQFTGKMTLLK